ncbi:hypothetical protein JHN53_36310 [Streptomyces sp. MBT58]|uniref:hypothetical protein n=1 Tax=Streptomyces sp. MBT58 TaxID=1488389 RepID=UPI001912EC3A|nr:hypothetical protein [Streptomyces sp. MBT58]MBK5996972.1 hypothetical protein [Streptomyces sp. MBT58]
MRSPGRDRTVRQTVVHPPHQLPRLPLAEQQRYGEQFRALAAFEDALRTAGRLGGQLVRGMYDGLTDGTVTPR